MSSRKKERAPRPGDAETATTRVAARVPLVEERAVIGKRDAEGRTVRVRTKTETRDEWIDETVATEEVHVERVAIDRVVKVAPAVRQEGDVTIIPVVEEVLVVRKQLLLREEIHVRKTTSSERVRESVTLRRTGVTIDDEP